MNVIEKLNSIKNGELTAKENVENFLKVIKEKNDSINAFIELNEENALKQAEEIDEKIAIIKHTINLVNVTNEIAVSDKMYTIDTVLVKMAQMNKRKEFLDRLRKMQPKTRINSSMYGARKVSPEYQYINFDIEVVKKEYEELDSQIAIMQIELDKFNQTFEFEVEI